MTYLYNPTVTELRQAYEVAYGDNGAYGLIGALYANVTKEVIERLYKEALAKVQSDMNQLVVCVYCEQMYPAGTAVCPECNEYDGLSLYGERENND